MKRRYQPTFLLRLVILVGGVGLVVLTWTVLNSLEMTVATLVAVAALWFVGLELGILELIVVGLFRKHFPETVTDSGLWFTDLREQRRRDHDEEVDRLSSGSADNPTMR